MSRKDGFVSTRLLLPLVGAPDGVSESRTARFDALLERTVRISTGELTASPEEKKDLHERAWLPLLREEPTLFSRIATPIVRGEMNPDILDLILGHIHLYNTLLREWHTITKETKVIPVGYQRSARGSNASLRALATWKKNWSLLEIEKRRISFGALEEWHEQRGRFSQEFFPPETALGKLPRENAVTRITEVFRKFTPRTRNARPHTTPLAPRLREDEVVLPEPVQSIPSPTEDIYTACVQYASQVHGARTALLAKRQQHSEQMQATLQGMMQSLMQGDYETLRQQSDMFRGLEHSQNKTTTALVATYVSDRAYPALYDSYWRNIHDRMERLASTTALNNAHDTNEAGFLGAARSSVQEKILGLSAPDATFHAIKRKIRKAYSQTMSLESLLVKISVLATSMDTTILGLARSYCTDAERQLAEIESLRAEITSVVTAKLHTALMPLTARTTLLAQRRFLLQEHDCLQERLPDINAEIMHCEGSIERIHQEMELLQSQIAPINGLTRDRLLRLVDIISKKECAIVESIESLKAAEQGRWDSAAVHTQTAQSLTREANDLLA